MGQCVHSKVALVVEGHVSVATRSTGERDHDTATVQVIVEAGGKQKSVFASRTRYLVNIRVWKDFFD